MFYTILVVYPVFQFNHYFLSKADCFCTFTGWTGLLCPCVLFGRNVERLREDTPWTTPCVCHAIFVEGGIALAAATAAFHGVIDPHTSFLICEGLLFSWWMRGIYTGLVRQSLQKNYHLKVIHVFFFSFFENIKLKLCFICCLLIHYIQLDAMVFYFLLPLKREALG